MMDLVLVLLNRSQLYLGISKTVEGTAADAATEDFMATRDLRAGRVNSANPEIASTIFDCLLGFFDRRNSCADDGGLGQEFTRRFNA
jgi:hypothetical protein